MTAVRTAVADDGAEIAFDDSGRGWPVLWLHGINEDRFSWTPVTELLTDEMRCIRLDFRGHGQSAHQGPYPAGLVSDVIAVIREAGVSSPLVVGHSLGGAIATIGAAMGVVGGAVCIDQPLKLGALTKLIQPLAPQLRKRNSYPDALMSLKVELGLARVPRPLFAEIERKTRTSDQNVVLETWKPMLEGDIEAVRANELAMAEALAAIRVPYLALHSHAVEADYEEWFRDCNPGARFELWPRLGHWLHLVDPTRFVNRIRDFAAAARD